MQNSFADTKRALANLMTAIKSGIITKTTKQHFQEFEITQAKLKLDIDSYKLCTPELNE